MLRAAEGARRLDDALRVAAGALGPVGVLLLRRPAGPSRPAQRRRRAAGAARARARSSRCSAPIPSTACTEPIRRSPAMFEQLGVIGCGLMGGSFALALKRAGLVKRVIGYSKSPSTTEQAQAASASSTPARRVGAARRLGLRHRADRGAGLGDRGHLQGDPPPGRAGRAGHGRRLDQARRRRRRAARAEGPHRLVRAGASDRRQGSRRHRARRRRAVQRPPGDPDAAAARPRPSWCRRRPTPGPRSARRCCA